MNILKKYSVIRSFTFLLELFALAQGQRKRPPEGGLMAEKIKGRN